MAANAPEQCHHSMRQLHPHWCCDKQCWQKKKKKKRTVSVSEEEWKAGAALFSRTGTEHIHLLSTEPRQPSCDTDLVFFCRGCWIRFCRGTTVERLTAPWWRDPGPSVSPWTWIENAPFTGHDLAVAEPLPFLLLHVKLNICSSERWNCGDLSNPKKNYLSFEGFSRAFKGQKTQTKRTLNCFHMNGKETLLKLFFCMWAYILI